jgi:hypothetical protein
VHAFSDEAVRAAVATGDLGNAESERYLADTLIRRRDKIVAYYFARVNPLAGFQVDAGKLRFRNLGDESHLGRPAGYDVEWSIFDNATGARRSFQEDRGDQVPIPIPGSDADYIAARIITRSATEPAWAQPVTVFLRRAGGAWEVVGIERAANRRYAAGGTR